MAFRAAVLALALVAAACGDDDGEDEDLGQGGAAAEAEPTAMAISATEYAFDTAETVPSGAVAVTLTNQGREAHHAQIVGLGEGRGVDDLIRELSTPGPLPEWMSLHGGVGPLAPAGSATTFSDLDAGDYALLCFLPGEDGAPHFAKGMVHAFSVTESGDEPPMPETSETIVARDYEFEAPALQAGRQVLAVRNEGPQVHEWNLARLAPGKTAQDLIAFVEGGGGEPPGELVGGYQAVARGGTGAMEVDAQPGTYVLVCFVPDEGDGRPHALHGMVQELTVS